MAKKKSPFGSGEETVECFYNGAVFHIPENIFLAMVFRKDFAKKKFTRYREGAEMFHMSESEFYKLAHDANAIYKRNKMAMVNIEMVDRYLELYREV